VTRLSSTWLTNVQQFRQSFDYQDNDWQQTVQLKADIAAHLAQNLGKGLSKSLFDRIVTWKLDKQEPRTDYLRVNITDDLISKITACAFSLVHRDRDFLAEMRLNALSAFPGVNMGVASAILALTFPNEYGVIDPRIWKHVYNEVKDGFSMSNFAIAMGHAGARLLYLENTVSLRWPFQKLETLCLERTEVGSITLSFSCQQFIHEFPGIRRRDFLV
jgi:hypothetical protein